MERTYYEKLGVDMSLSCEEIEKAIISAIGENDELTPEQEEMFLTLIDPKTRMAYDQYLINSSESKERYNYITGEAYAGPSEEELAMQEEEYNEFFAQEEVAKAIDANETKYAVAIKNVNQGFFRRHWKKLVLIGAAAIALAVGARSCGKDKENEGNKIHTVATPIPGVNTNPTVAPTATPVPTVAPTATPAPTVAPTATPTPIVPEEVTQLNSENIDVVASYIVEQNRAKGLELNEEEVKAALVFANVGSIEKEQLKEITSGVNSDEEYNKACNYFVAVQSHNINLMMSTKAAMKEAEELLNSATTTEERNAAVSKINEILTQICNNYATMSSISYTDTDKHVLQSLDQYSISLIANSNAGTLTSEEYQSLFKNVMHFYFEIGKGLEVGEMVYPYSDLSAGGKFVAEMMSPNFSVPFTISKHATQENRDFVSSLENRIIDGVEYLNEMFELYEGDKVR